MCSLLLFSPLFDNEFVAFNFYGYLVLKKLLNISTEVEVYPENRRNVVEIAVDNERTSTKLASYL